MLNRGEITAVIITWDWVTDSRQLALTVCSFPIFGIPTLGQTFGKKNSETREIKIVGASWDCE